MTVQKPDHQVLSPQGASFQTDLGPWSEWGVRLLAILSLALTASLAWIWIESSYRSVTVASRLSYFSSDKPWMPIDSVARPIIGNHFFGDFQLPFAWGGNLLHTFSPYLSSSIPENYTPLAAVFFVPFHLLSLRYAALVYLVLSAAVFLVPLWLLLAPLKWEYRVIFLAPVAVLTAPFVTTVDRGNTIGIGMGLVAWAIWAWRSESWMLCGAFLALAVAFKGYPAALLVVPLALRRYRFTTLVAASAVALNLLALMLYPGGYLRNLRAALPAQGSLQLTQANPLDSWSLYSILPKTAGFFFGPSAANQLVAPGRILLWLPSAIYLCCVYYVIRRAVVPQWCWGPLALASVQMVVPVSAVYCTAWAPIAAVWFAWGYLVRQQRTGAMGENGESQWVALRVLILITLTVTLTPSIFTLTGADGFTVPAARYLSPLLVFATLVMATVRSVRPGDCLRSAVSRTAEAADDGGIPDQSQCPVGSTALQLVLNSFGSTGRFGLTCIHEAPSGVVGRALPAAH
jgi:hypothetical protein